MKDAAGTFTGGKIANSEFGIDNKINGINLSELFYDITEDSTTGIVSLKRINGKPANFNIAALQAYKDMLSKVASIKIEFKVSGDG